MDKPTLDQVRSENDLRILDTWVAVFVLGWKYMGKGVTETILTTETGDASVLSHCVSYYAIPPFSDAHTQQVPYYSTNSGAAEMITAHFIKNGYEVSMEYSNMDGLDSYKWRVHFDRFTNDPLDYIGGTGSSDVQEQAICRAALTTVLYPVGHTKDSEKGEP